MADDPGNLPTERQDREPRTSSLMWQARKQRSNRRVVSNIVQRRGYYEGRASVLRVFEHHRVQCEQWSAFASLHQ